VYGTGVLAAAALGKVAPAVPLLRTDLGLSLGMNFEPGLIEPAKPDGATEAPAANEEKEEEKK